MFSFLNRTKHQAENHVSSTSSPMVTTTVGSSTNTADTVTVNGNNDQTSTTTNGDLNGLSEKKNAASKIELDINDARKNLLEAILLKRTDIVVSLINEWNKGNSENIIAQVFQHTGNLSVCYIICYSQCFKFS